MKKTSSFEDTDTDQESTSSASRAPLHHSKYAQHTLPHKKQIRHATSFCITKLCWSYRKKKTMKLSRALSDLVKYTRSVGLYDIEAQGEHFYSLVTDTKFMLQDLRNDLIAVLFTLLTCCLVPSCVFPLFFHSETDWWLGGEGLYSDCTILHPEKHPNHLLSMVMKPITKMQFIQQTNVKIDIWPRKRKGK